MYHQVFAIHSSIVMCMTAKTWKYIFFLSLSCPSVLSLTRQRCRLNICSYIDWIDKFNQYIYNYLDGSAVYPWHLFIPLTNTYFWTPWHLFLPLTNPFFLTQKISSIYSTIDVLKMVDMWISPYILFGPDQKISRAEVSESNNSLGGSKGIVHCPREGFGTRVNMSSDQVWLESESQHLIGFNLRKLNFKIPLSPNLVSGLKEKGWKEIWSFW